jgi:tRNA A-37 threonylcarbamoyl transferase component Bud32
MPSPAPEDKAVSKGPGSKLDSRVGPGAPPSMNDPSTSTPNFSAMDSREKALLGAAPGPSFVLSSELPKIEGYDILAEVGRGNMGVIYKARQHRLNRIVALKMILAGKHADETQRRRFETEAEAVARLQHSNIVQVYDIGEYEEQPFLVMEFVDGGSLERRLRGRMLSPKAAAQLILVLAKAMHAAHQAGIVHRDLKPGNILITSKGIPKITDFGLAKKLDADSNATASGTILGTPSYMAPEQARSNKLPTTAATDVYGLGAILYELLTGRPPFKEETFLDTMLQVVSTPPVPVLDLNDTVPPRLADICMKCLAKDPTERYMTARQLADALTQFLTAYAAGGGAAGGAGARPAEQGEPAADGAAGAPAEVEEQENADEIIDLSTAQSSKPSLEYQLPAPSLGDVLRAQPMTATLMAVALLLVGLGLSAVIVMTRGQALHMVTLPLAIVLGFAAPTPLVLLFSVLLGGASLASAFALGMDYPSLPPALLGCILGGMSRLIAWLSDRRVLHVLLGAFYGLLAGIVLLYQPLNVNVYELATWKSEVYLLQILVTTTGTMLMGAFTAVLMAPRQSE